jgi:hypothetical protein
VGRHHCHRHVETSRRGTEAAAFDDFSEHRKTGQTIHRRILIIRSERMILTDISGLSNSKGKGIFNPTDETALDRASQQENRNG